MANIELDAGSGGSIVRTVQKTVGADTVQIATAAIDVGNHATGTELLVGDANVFMPVHGAAADDDSAAGNPILVGAKYLASPESDQLDANDVGQLICDINRHLKVVIHGAGGSPVDPSVGLAIDDDGAASVTFSGLHTENYRTDGGGTDTTAALGVVVPGLTGAVSVGSVSVTNKTAGTDQPTVVGLNSAVVGAHITDFYTGDTPDDDVVNISAFGLAIPSSSGPVVIDNDSNKLSVNVSTIPDVQIASAGNTVKLEAADTAGSVIGTVKISTDDNTVQNKLTHIGTTAVDASGGDKSNGTQRVTIADDDTNLSAIKTAVELIDDAVSTDKIAIAGRTTISDASTATALLVDTAGHLQVDLQSSVSLDASGNTVKIDGSNNAVSLGTGTVHIAGRTDITDGSTVKALLVDTAGHLQVDVVSGGGGGTEYTEDAGAATDPVGGVSILVREDASSGALAGSLVDADGDNVAQRGTNYGSSYVTSVSSDGKVGVLEGWDYETSPAAQKVKVDSAGSVHIADANTYVSNFDNAGGETVNASSYGVVVPSASGPVVVDGDADGLNTKSMAIVQDDISSNSFTNDLAKQLRVDATGALHVTGSGGSSAYVYVDDADWSATSSSHALIGGVYQSTRGTITDGDTGPARLTSTGQVHAYLDDVTFDYNDPATTGKVLLAGARSYNSIGAPNQTSWTDGDASALYVDGEANLRVTLNPTVKNGLSSYRSIGISSSYETVSASDACLYSISAFNMTASTLYLKIYDIAAPTSSSTPKFTFPIPANASSGGAGFIWNNPVGFPFFNAITIRVTTGLADANTDYPSAGDAIMNFGFHA